MLQITFLIVKRITYVTNFLIIFVNKLSSIMSFLKNGPFWRCVSGVKMCKECVKQPFPDRDRRVHTVFLLIVYRNVDFYKSSATGRVADPQYSLADPEPHFHCNADQNPAFHLYADANPAPHQGDANLRPRIYRPSRAPFWATTPPLWASTTPVWASKAPGFFSYMRIRIRIHLPYK